MAKQALYVKGKVDFEQPSHGVGGTSSAKNKSKVGFKQNPAIGKAGKNKTGMMNVKGKVDFTQKTAPMTKNSSAKNAGKVGFDQPNRAGKTVAMPKATGGSVGKGDKIKKAKNVGPKFKSMDDVKDYAKKKYKI